MIRCRGSPHPPARPPLQIGPNDDLCLLRPTSVSAADYHPVPGQLRPTACDSGAFWTGSAGERVRLPACLSAHPPALLARSRPAHLLPGRKAASSERLPSARRCHCMLRRQQRLAGAAARLHQRREWRQLAHLLAR